MAEWLNSIGVTGIVLKYRVPTPARASRDAVPALAQDAQRAISLVRSQGRRSGASTPTASACSASPPAAT